LKFTSIFVTGTDTGVGKTAVSCGIAAVLRRRGWKVGVFKPSETGCLPGPGGELQPDDALRLKFFADCHLDVRIISPYRFRQPLAPQVAAEQEGRHIEVTEIVRCYAAIAAAHDITLIEGAGGLLVPLSRGVTFADLASQLDVPVLVVVGSRLGAINHALLTMRYAQSAGLRVLGYIVNFPAAGDDLAATTNVAVLSEWLGPPLGVVPYLGKLEMTEASRERLGELLAAQVRIDAILEKC
jgi:dethiobiotin synthetase